jgi:hypothetical protein
MWRLIYALRRWRSQQQRRVKCLPQSDCCLNVGAQVCDHDMIGFGVPSGPMQVRLAASVRLMIPFTKLDTGARRKK